MWGIQKKSSKFRRSFKKSIEVQRSSRYSKEVRRNLIYSKEVRRNPRYSEKVRVISKKARGSWRNFKSVSEEVWRGQPKDVRNLEKKLRRISKKSKEVQRSPKYSEEAKRDPSNSEEFRGISKKEKLFLWDSRCTEKFSETPENTK